MSKLLGSVEAVVLSSLLILAPMCHGQTWTQTSAPTANWTSIASCADGSNLVAVVGGGPIYCSTNSGLNWAIADAPVTNWRSVACSAGGTRWVAVVSDGGIYLSTNSAATWTSTSAPSQDWQAVVSSADGNQLLAAAAFSTYASWAGGATWTLATAPSWYLNGAAASADGTKLVIAGMDFVHLMDPDSIYTSTNSGVTWTLGNVSDKWGAVAESADGAVLVGAASSPYGIGRIYTSIDSGDNWTPTSAPNVGRHSVAVSADGARLVPSVGFAGPFGSHSGPIYTSTNSGVTWSSNNVPDAFVVTSSADGSKLAAVTLGSGIWVSQSTSTPPLKLAVSGSASLISWTVPSTTFVLQANSNPNTSNWSDETNTPTLNLTTLRNEVSVPVEPEAHFYRLKH